MKSAEQQVLESIDELLAGQDDQLIMPMNVLNQATAKIVEKNAKIITRMQDKLLRVADKQTTRSMDHLDGVFTRVMGGLDSWQFDMNFLLTQLAAKGGFTKAGEPLEAALMQEATRAPDLAYGATLVLAVKEAIPFFTQLIEVLREIRDRMSPQAIKIAGETPAEEPEVEAEAQTDEATEGPVEDDDYEWIDEPHEA